MKNKRLELESKIKAFSYGDIKIVYEHKRCYTDKGYPVLLTKEEAKNRFFNMITTKGGKTICKFIEKDTTISFGIASCIKKDVFNYEVGREVSLKNALRSYFRTLPLERKKELQKFLFPNTVKNIRRK